MTTLHLEHGTSSQMKDVSEKLEEAKKNINKLKELYLAIDVWITVNPDEFEKKGGKQLVDSLQKTILEYVGKSRLDMKKLKEGALSVELKSLNEKILWYNANKSKERLEDVKGAIDVWKKANIEEYNKFYGKQFAESVKGLLESNTYSYILTPNAHPETVFEKSLAFRPDEGRNAYLNVFYNTVAPWAHAEIIFMGSTGFSEKATLEESLLKEYIQDGMLSKDFEVVSFPSKDRRRVQDICDYVINPNNKKIETPISLELLESFFTQEEAQSEKYETVQQLAMELRELLVGEKFINEEGVVQKEWFDAIKDGGRPLEVSNFVWETIVSIMPSLLDPEKFYEQVQEEKSKKAFAALKEELNEQGQFKLFQSSQGESSNKETGSSSAIPITEEQNKKILECLDYHIWSRIDKAFPFDPEYADYVKTIIAKPIEAGKFDEKTFIIPTVKDVISGLRECLTSKTSELGEERCFLDPGKKIPETLSYGLQYQAELLSQNQTHGAIGKRKYLGIGAEGDFLDSISQHSEGVRIADTKIIKRMEAIASRRKNEIQKQMNIFAGIGGAVRSFAGELSKRLITKEERLRHLRQGLVDNFLMSIDPKAFLPDLKETRYRLEIYESGGETYKKWIEDPNGQFSKVKSPSSQNVSGEHIEGEYKKNSYILGEDNRLKS
ncbi:MAG: hypothetical protein JSS09_07600, partial [Verrucomicrobia bacterium]|nr:hypothetical protein [Verrucomicrobiota bacterium]